LARIGVIVGEEMLASRVTASLQASGHELVRLQGADPARPSGVELVVADLDAISPEELAGAAVPVIAFYPHTDAEVKRRADDAGLAMAVPRSRMARELPELVARLIGP
jgi:hypothetical protein